MANKPDRGLASCRRRSQVPFVTADGTAVATTSTGIERLLPNSGIEAYDVWAGP